MADATPEIQPDAGPDMPVSPDDVREVVPSGATRLSDLVASRLADQARRTAQAARAGRVSNTGGEPGMLDMTPCAIWSPSWPKSCGRSGRVSGLAAR